MKRLNIGNYYQSLTSDWRQNKESIIPYDIGYEMEGGEVEQGLKEETWIN